MRIHTLETGLVALLFVLAGGCAEGAAVAGSHGTGPSDEASSAAHVHPAPHGGVLVDLVQDAATVEVVVDAVAGRLDLYLLGPHLAEYVRSTQESIGVRLLVGADAFTVDAEAQASPLTGETLGDTSHFAALDERLTDVRRLDGTLVRVEMLGQTFEEERFSWTEDTGK